MVLWKKKRLSRVICLNPRPITVYLCVKGKLLTLSFNKSQKCHNTFTDKMKMSVMSTLQPPPYCC